MFLAPVLNQQMAEQLEKLPNNLSSINQASRKLLADKPLPVKFSETWKYTHLFQLEKGHLKQYSDAGSVSEILPNFGTEPLVIINGRLPEVLPEWPGVKLSRLNGDSQSSLASTSFALFNGAGLQEGLKVQVDKNQPAQGLFHVIFYSSGQGPSYHNTRLVIELAESSSLNIVEHYMGDAEAVLCNAVTEIHVGENSRLQHIRLQSEANDNLHIGQLAIEQQAHSRIDSFQFMTASRLKRNDVHVQIKGQGAELEMHGAYLAKGDYHIDNQVAVDHCVPNCQSHQNYKGIAGDQGQATFNGRIHILEGASQTQADLSNHNLLLNVGAEINTKPELEIYNEDVKCSHGTTIGQIDESMRFYLQSRGISEKEAQRILSIGFIKQELASLPFENLSDWIGDWLSQAVAEGL